MNAFERRCYARKCPNPCMSRLNGIPARPCRHYLNFRRYEAFFLRTGLVTSLPIFGGRTGNVSLIAKSMTSFLTRNEKVYWADIACALVNQGFLLAATSFNCCKDEFLLRLTPCLKSKLTEQYGALQQQALKLNINLAEIITLLAREQEQKEKTERQLNDSQASLADLQSRQAQLVHLTVAL